MSLIIYDLGNLTFPNYTSSDISTLSNIKKGDAINFAGALVDLDNVAIDTTNWLIRAEMYDDSQSIRKGSALVLGGDDSQAEWILETAGTFQIHFGNLETNIFSSTVSFEIKIETDTGERITIYQSLIEFSDSRINWSDV